MTDHSEPLLTEPEKAWISEALGILTAISIFPGPEPDRARALLSWVPGSFVSE